MTEGNKPVFEELARIASRLHQISEGAFEDMEGANADEFKESEGVYVGAHLAATVLDKLAADYMTIHCHRCGGDWHVKECYHKDGVYCPACPEHKDEFSSLSERKP